MFGYVTVNQEELKMKDHKRYRSFYCGLCGSLKKRYGLKGQAILPYDMAFLDILLNGLYEIPLEEKDQFCITHPTKKQHMLFNSITDYAADMGVLLAYYKLLDDVADDKSHKAKAGVRMLKKHIPAIRAAWPRQAEAIEKALGKLRELEAVNSTDLDAVAGATGEMLGEIFVMKEDMWADILRRMGFYLGKFISLMDAFEDLDEDLKKGHYNPWSFEQHRKDFDALVENTLTMMMAECAKEFEKLPIVQDIDILRNIVYSGVWMKYNELLAKKNGTEKEDA